MRRIACLVLVAACAQACAGDHGGARTGPVTVMWTEGSADGIVAFHDADGLVLDVVHAGASGVAASTVPGIAAITAYSAAGGLRTFFGVGPGDTVSFDARGRQRHVILPGAYPGATRYGTYGACGAGNGSGADPTTLETVCDATDGTHIVSFAENGALEAYTTSFGATTDPITLGPWRTDFDSIPVAMLNHDPAAGLRTFPYLGTSVGLLNIGDIWNDRAHVARDLPPDLPLLVLAEESFAPTEWRAISIMAERTGASVTIDFATAPHVASWAVDRSDPARPAMTWVATGSIAMASALIELPGGRGPRWLVSAPGPLARLQAPSLPPELAAHAPLAPSALVDLSLHDTVATRDYASYLAHPWTFGGPRGSVGAVVILLTR